MNRDCIENRLVEFLRTLSGDAALNGHTELLDEGIVDSLSMMDILVFIESQFQARLDLRTSMPGPSRRLPAWRK